MKIQQLFENEEQDGVRETGLTDLQEVINVYRSRINKWTVTSATSKATATKLTDNGQHADAEQSNASAAIADRNIRKNTKILNFLQTVHNLMSERTPDGDKEARDFRDSSMPEDSFDPVGPSVYLPKSVVQWMQSIPH